MGEHKWISEEPEKECQSWKGCLRFIQPHSCMDEETEGACLKSHGCPDSRRKLEKGTEVDWLALWANNHRLNPCITIWSRFHYPHFTDKNTKAQEVLAQRWKLCNGNILRLILQSILGLMQTSTVHPSTLISKVTIRSGSPESLLVSTCCCSVISNSTSFLSQKCPGWDNKFIVWSLCHLQNGDINITCSWSGCKESMGFCT